MTQQVQVQENTLTITDTSTSTTGSTDIAPVTVTVPCSKNDSTINDPNKNNILKLLPIRMKSTVIHGYGRGSNDLGIPTANLDLNPLLFQSSLTTSNTNTTTTNNKKDHNTIDNLPTGIYWGYARIVHTDDTVEGSNNDTIVYKAAISIGYCPTYNNKSITIEPHLIAPIHDKRRYASKTNETILYNFYNTTLRLSIVGYIRPELPFTGLDSLITAIKNDIILTEQLAILYNDDDDTNNNNDETPEDTSVGSSSSTDNLPRLEYMWVQSNEPVV